MRPPVLGHNVSLDPGSRHRRIVGNLVLCLARFYAQATAPALDGIDEESPPDFRLFDRRSRLFSRKKRKRAQGQDRRERAAHHILQEDSS